MDTKLVIILRDDLPPGAAANAAAVLAMSLATQLEPYLGAPGQDASGRTHAGLNTHPAPILTASSDALVELQQRAVQTEGVAVVGFTDVARRAREYDDYLNRLSRTAAADVSYAGVAVFGPRSLVSRLTRRFHLMP